MAGPAFFILPTPLPFHYKPQINCNNPYKLPRSTRLITTLTHSNKHTQSLVTTAYLSHHTTFISTLFPSSLSYKSTIFLTLTDNPSLILLLTTPHILHIPSAHTYPFSIHFLYNSSPTTFAPKRLPKGSACHCGRSRLPFSSLTPLFSLQFFLLYLWTIPYHPLTSPPLHPLLDGIPLHLPI